MVIFAIFHSSVYAGKLSGHNETISLSCDGLENCRRMCCDSANKCDEYFRENGSNFTEYLTNYNITYGKPCEKMKIFEGEWNYKVR